MFAYVSVSLSVCVLCAGAYAFFCFPCFMCTLATKMNECMCGPFCFDRPFVWAMRTKVRSMYGIRVSRNTSTTTLWALRRFAMLWPGVSEVLLCPYRYLKDIMVNSKNSKSTLLLLPVPDNSASQSYLSSCNAQCLSSLFLNEFKRTYRRGSNDRER